MGSVQTRENINPLTSDNLLIGVPFVEFAFKTGANQFSSYRQLGIVQSAAISKDVEVVSLRSAHSGTDQLVRELVRRFEGRLNVGVSQFDSQNMQLFFGSAAAPAAIAAGSTSVSGDSVILPAYPAWGDLTNLIEGTTWTSLTPTTITGEAVGTGDGVTLVFNLSQKLDTGDISNVVIYLNGIDATTAGAPLGPFTLVEGPTALTTEIAIDEDAVPAFDGGTRVTFNVLQVPAAGTLITADFIPTHTLVEDTDYIVDYVDGRIRRVAADAAGEILRANQSVDAAYDTEDFTGFDLEPYTQFVFEGRARLKLLTDIGINIIWPIPLVNLRLNDDDFEFSREEFGEGSLTITLIDDGTATPFGTMQVYEEDAA